MKRVIVNIEAEFLFKNKDYNIILDIKPAEFNAFAKQTMKEIQPKHGRIKRFEFTSIKGEE